ncbi:fimbrial biogenesis chaperone [Vibrio furnissii]|uniref:fimbrial biogenesis chaperone n=1 Tax=Vibrio furnissii TaxID=29494 RepID=UPI003D7C55C8
MYLAHRIGLIILLVFSINSVASVVMTNTRVIYYESQSDNGMQFSNKDDFPYLVQVWVDEGNPSSTIQTQSDKFSVVPPIFRIEANSGQRIRVFNTNKALPKDRESVFYLNMVQIPPTSKAAEKENKMLIVLKNRVKLFYRPTDLQDSVEEIDRNLSFSVSNTNGWQVVAQNNSSYHVTINNIVLKSGDKTWPIENSMLTPKSMLHWTLNDFDPSLTNYEVDFYLINDFGAHVKKSYAIKL